MLPALARGGLVEAIRGAEDLYAVMADAVREEPILASIVVQEPLPDMGWVRSPAFTHGTH